MKPDTAALCEAFERVRERPGTIELFDAVAAEDALAVAAALGRFPRHPFARDLGVWLAARGVDAPERPTPEEILARHGIDDLEARLEADQRDASRLRESLERAFVRAERAESVASAYAAILLLVVGVAVVGWAAALGVLPIFAPPPAEEPRVGDPTSGGAEP